MQRIVGELGTPGAEEGSAADGRVPLSLIERLNAEIAALQELDIEGLRKEWRRLFRAAAPPHPQVSTVPDPCLWDQANALGDLDRETIRYLDQLAR
jgi:hypothetical protein